MQSGTLAVLEPRVGLVQSGAVIIILSFSFVVFCLLFLFACVVVLPHYVVNKDEYTLYYIGALQCHRSLRSKYCCAAGCTDDVFEACRESASVYSDSVFDK